MRAPLGWLAVPRNGPSRLFPPSNEGFTRAFNAIHGKGGSVRFLRAPPMGEPGETPLSMVVALPR